MKMSVFNTHTDHCHGNGWSSAHALMTMWPRQMNKYSAKKTIYKFIIQRAK